MTQLVAMLLGVSLFPVVGLAFLLWMARLEDSLPAAVRRAERRPDPEPILAIVLPSPRDRRPVTPLQVVEVVAQRQASEVALSSAPSLGGSTNR